MISRELFNQLADAVFEFNEWSIENDKTYNASMQADKNGLLLYLYNGKSMDYYVNSGDESWHNVKNEQNAKKFINILNSRKKA